MGQLRINQRFGYGTAQTWIRNDSTLGTNRPRVRNDRTPFFLALQCKN